MTENMSIAELKLSLADVPGIETLRMDTIAGRQQFGWNGLLVAVDPMADQETIEKAIRKVATHKMSETLVPPMTLNGSTAVAKSTPRAVQRLNVTGAGFVGQSFKDQMQALKADFDRLPGELAEALQRAQQAKQVGKNIVASVHSEVDDLMQVFGQFTNDTGEDHG